jgi:integrase
MNAEKVTQLYRNNILDYIDKFLRQKGRKSEDTRIAYKKDIEDFFLLVKEKELPFVTLDDIQITLDDFDEFIDTLASKGELTGSTINRKISTVKSLLHFLQPRVKSLGVDIDTQYFKQVETLPENVRHYSVLSIEEVMKMAQLAKETERQKKLIKYYLILFATDTCIRQSAILNLKWSDFVEGEDCVEISSVDKGNKEFRKKIAKEFYDELLTLKEEGCDRVFKISRDAVSDMMKRLRIKMNFSEGRYIVFHSFRKAGITFAYRLTGDHLAAMKAGNHSSFNTTKNYIEDNDYGAIGAYSVTKNLDTNILKELTHEELLNLIYSMKKDTQIIMTRKAQEIYKEKFAVSE